MARVAIFDGPKQTWIQFDDDTEVLIEYLTRPAAIELNKTVDKLQARSAGDRQLIWGQQLGERCVHGWRHINQKDFADHPGLVMPDGKPIPFNAENRDLMMKHCREFSLFVNESAIDSQAHLGAAAGTAGGNG